MNEIEAYRDHAIGTQSRGRVIVLLYDGAVKFLRQALQEMDKKDWAAKGKYISKAVAIIDELDACLDLEAGGEVAENLRKLYDFLRRHLHQANMKRDPQRIHEAIKILLDLNESWKAITA
jgi:flagellar protein FliS